MGDDAEIADVVLVAHGVPPVQSSDLIIHYSMGGRGWQGRVGRISGGPVQGAGRRPGGAAAEAGEARLFRRSRNGLRP